MALRNISSKRAKALSIPSSVKHIVYERDRGLCVYCRKPGLPEAHYIPRSKGGLGIPENVLTLCRPCHDKYDNGRIEVREGMREYFQEYLQSIYPNWNEDELIYRKDGT